MIGLGAALENLVLAAGPRGYRTTVTTFPSPESTHVARVVLEKSDAAFVDVLASSISARHSNRGPYQRSTIEPATIQALGSHASPSNGLAIVWFTTTDQRASMSALMIDAAQAIVDDHTQSVDGFAWFRSSEAAIEQHRDGLTDWGQDLSDVISSAAILLPPTSRTAGDQFWLNQTKNVHTATAAAYGVITVGNAMDPMARLNGGRLLQRLHLAAVAGGLGFQHMNQITERIDRDASLGVQATFADRFDVLLGSTGSVALSSFRIGHPLAPGRWSPRRPVGWVS